MLVNIRIGEFETNSSSMHSLAVRKAHKKETKEDIEYVRCEPNISEKGVLYISDYYKYAIDRESFIPIYSMFEKISYLIYYLGNLTTREEVIKFLEREIYPIIKEYYPEFNKINISENIDFLIDTWNKYEFRIVLSKDEEKEDENNTVPYLFELLDDLKISFKDFLTDTAYQIICDGENGIFTEMYKRAGIIHEEDYEKFYMI